jgi:predicted nucleotidyltransferase
VTPVLQAILGALRAAEPALRESGVLSLALAGSIARGTAHDRSDVDVVVDLDPARELGVLALVDIRQRIESRVGRKADVLERRALRPEIRAALERDAVPVF